MPPILLGDANARASLSCEASFQPTSIDRRSAAASVRRYDCPGALPPYQLPIRHPVRLIRIRPLPRFQICDIHPEVGQRFRSSQ